MRPECACLEQLGSQHEAAARKIGLLVQGHLQQALHKGAHTLGADIRLHCLEHQAQEHGRLVGVAHIRGQQQLIQCPALTHTQYQRSS